MRALIILSLLFASGLSHAEKPSEPDFDTLGGNAILLEKARALQPEKEVRVVQARTVDRRRRTELNFDLSGVMGGETYMHTQTVGVAANYHFNPRWSVGVKYNYAFNSLTAEGEAMVERAEADFQANPENPGVPYPELDYVKDEALAIVNWYPIYGKLNLLDRAVAHFDIYALVGGGQMRLRSGPTSTYTAGAGVGLWLNPHLSTRFEVRYQGYTARYLTGTEDMDLTVASLQMGWLL